MKLIPTLAATLAFALAACPSLAQDDDDADAPSLEEQYPGLLLNNPFVKDRKPPRAQREPTSRPTTTRPAEPPAVPEKDWVLTGIVFEGGQFRAYFENLKTNQIQQVSTGMELARGHVGEVFIDSVAFLIDDELRWVSFGQDLTGQLSEALAAAAAQSAAAGASASGADRGGDPNESIADRLRRRREEREQRRQQEQQQQQQPQQGQEAQPQGQPQEAPPEQAPPEQAPPPVVIIE